MLWRGAWKVVLEEFFQKWLFGQKEAGMQSCTEGLSVRTLALTWGSHRRAEKHRDPQKLRQPFWGTPCSSTSRPLKLLTLWIWSRTSTAGHLCQRSLRNVVKISLVDADHCVIYNTEE